MLGLCRNTHRFCFDGAEQFREIPDLNALERTHGILDFAAQPEIDSAIDESVEFLDRVLPCEWMGSEAGIVLNLMVDHLPIRESDSNFRRHFPRVELGVVVVRPNRYLLQQALH